MEEMLGSLLGLLIVWLADRMFGMKGAACALIALMVCIVLIGGLDLFHGASLFSTLFGR